MVTHALSIDGAAQNNILKTAWEIEPINQKRLSRQLLMTGRDRYLLNIIVNVNASAIKFTIIDLTYL
jgi:hypothetical protein